MCVTSDQSNLTKGRIAPAHGRFNRRPIRLLHGPIRVHVANGISIGLAVFAQLTTDHPYSLQLAVSFPLQIAPSHGGSRAHIIHGFFSPPESTTQTASW